MDQLNAIDRKILMLLQQNANLRVKEIAEQIGLSTTPTYERIKKMEKDGVIEKYVTIINPEMIDKALLVYCNVTLKEHSQKTLENFEQEVVELEEVMEILCMSGNCDYQLKVATRDMKSYHHFVINKLSAIDNIANVQSSFVMRTVKNETAYHLE